MVNEIEQLQSNITNIWHELENFKNKINSRIWKKIDIQEIEEEKNRIIEKVKKLQEEIQNEFNKHWVNLDEESRTKLEEARVNLDNFTNEINLSLDWLHKSITNKLKDKNTLIWLWSFSLAWILARLWFKKYKKKEKGQGNQEWKKKKNFWKKLWNGLWAIIAIVLSWIWINWIWTESWWWGKKNKNSSENKSDQTSWKWDNKKSNWDNLKNNTNVNEWENKPKETNPNDGTSTNNWDGVTKSSKTDLEKEKELDEKRENVESSIVTNTTINYLKARLVIKLFWDKTYKLLDDKTEQKVRDILNAYLNKYPILKMNRDRKMKLEITNKTEFASMVSKLRETMVDSLPTVVKWGFKSLSDYKNANSKLSDINKSLPNLSAREYEEIIFWYVGWVVKDIVKIKKWTMTLEWYYNDISKIFPNKNSKKVKEDLLASGQLVKDMKDMRYPLA